MQRFAGWAFAADAVPADPLTALLQYGVLGIVVILLVIYTRGSIARERESADKAQQQVKELNEFIRAEMLPKQIEATVLHKQVAEVLEEAIQLITEMKIRENIRRDDGSSGGPRNV